MEHLLFSYFDLAFHLKGSLCANISTLIWDISTDKLFLCIFCFAEFITESFKGDRPEFKVLYHGVQDSWQTAAAAMAEYKGTE